MSFDLTVSHNHIDPKTPPKLLQKCSKIPSKISRKCSKNAPKMLQKCSKNAPKMLQKCSTYGVKSPKKFLNIDLYGKQKPSNNSNF